MFNRATITKLTALAICMLGVSNMAIAAPTPKVETEIPDQLMPHKALYEIKMVSRRSSAQILNISGQMFFEWQAMCDAWTTDHRFKLNYEYADSMPIQITSDFSTYETTDGETFNFSSRRKRDGELYEEIRGNAILNDEKAGEAAFSTPADLNFDLSGGTLFPMAHTAALLEAARRGEVFINKTVFDGSDNEGPVEINAFIKKTTSPIADIEPSPELDITLLNTPAWKIRMAFFPTINPEINADYEMEVIFHENGIISDMLVEYQDFSVTQKLVALEKIEPVKCNIPTSAKPLEKKKK